MPFGEMERCEQTDDIKLIEKVLAYFPSLTAAEKVIVNISRPERWSLIIPNFAG